MTNRTRMGRSMALSPGTVKAQGGRQLLFHSCFPNSGVLPSGCFRLENKT